MPPLGCCTFLTLDSTTSVPCPITAPVSLAVAAHPPIPPRPTTIAVTPTNLSLRIERSKSHRSSFIVHLRCLYVSRSANSPASLRVVDSDLSECPGPHHAVRMPFEPHLSKREPCHKH